MSRKQPNIEIPIEGRPSPPPMPPKKKEHVVFITVPQIQNETMILDDEISFTANLTGFCQKCKSGNIYHNDDPFLVDEMIVAVLQCRECKWGFVVHINISGKTNI